MGSDNQTAPRIHSAIVEMEVSLPDRQSLELAQLGPDFVIFSRPLDFEIAHQSKGVVTLEIDGEKQSWPVEFVLSAPVGAERASLVLVR